MGLPKPKMGLSAPNNFIIVKINYLCNNAHSHNLSLTTK